MIQVSKVIQLKEGEKVHAIVRRHGITLWPCLILAAVPILGPFSFYYDLVNWRIYGWIIFGLLELIGLYFIIRAFFLWNTNVLIVTSLRLARLEQSAWWRRTMKELPMDFVSEISCERSGLADAIFHMGTVRVYSSAAPTTAAMVARHLPRPERLVALVNELRSHTKRSDLHRLLDAADDLTIAAVERILKNPPGVIT